MPDKPFVEKWEKTGLLVGLEPADAHRMAVLLENQVIYLLRQLDANEDEHFKKKDLEFFMTLVLPLIRRVFSSVSFNWHAARTPAFRYGSCPEEAVIHCVCTEWLKTPVGTENIDRTDTLYGLEAELEFTTKLANQLISEFDHMFAGNSVVFYCPLVSMGRNFGNGATIRLASRYKIMSGPGRVI
jgi:hypothetical protein